MGLSDTIRSVPTDIARPGNTPRATVGRCQLTGLTKPYRHSLAVVKAEPNRHNARILLSSDHHRKGPPYDRRHRYDHTHRYLR